MGSALESVVFLLIVFLLFIFREEWQGTRGNVGLEFIDLECHNSNNYGSCNDNTAWHASAVRPTPPLSPTSKDQRAGKSDPVQGLACPAGMRPGTRAF